MPCMKSAGEPEWKLLFLATCHLCQDDWRVVWFYESIESFHKIIDRNPCRFFVGLSETCDFKIVEFFVGMEWTSPLLENKVFVNFADVVFFTHIPCSECFLHLRSNYEPTVSKLSDCIERTRAHTHVFLICKYSHLWNVCRF